MSQIKSHRFQYRLGLRAALAMVLVSVILTIASGYIASSMPDARFINALAAMTSRQAVQYMLWGMTGFCALLVLVVLVFVVQGLRVLRYVEIRPSSIFVPKTGFSMKLVDIPYGEIRNLRLVDVSGKTMLIISSRAGESRLMAQNFSSKNDFAAFISMLRERTNR